ncbi:hypothetical protein FAGKG844_400033 [Frankia sp. AgKG'84/4]
MERTTRKVDGARTCIGYREYPNYGMVSRYFLSRQVSLAEAERRPARRRRRGAGHQADPRRPAPPSAEPTVPSRSSPDRRGGPPERAPVVRALCWNRSPAVVICASTSTTGC